MGIEDRDWRREEVKQQRKIVNSHASDMSVNEYLASQRNKKPFPERSKFRLYLIILFLLIFFSSAAFLIYQFLG